MGRWVHVCEKTPVAKSKEECKTCDRNGKCKLYWEQSPGFTSPGKWPTELPVDLYGPRPSPEERRL